MALNVNELARWRYCDRITCQNPPTAWLVPHLLDRATILAAYAGPENGQNDSYDVLVKRTDNGWQESRLFESCENGVWHTAMHIARLNSGDAIWSGGYGEVGGTCNLKGMIAIAKPPYTSPAKLCLCDNASNCNLTSNVENSMAYAEINGRKIIVTGGGCGGKHAWIIDVTDTKPMGSITESAIRNMGSGANITLIPAATGSMPGRVLGIFSRNVSRGNYFRVGFFDLEAAVEDVISRYNGTPVHVNADDYSFEEIYKDPNANTACTPTPIATGDNVVYIQRYINGNLEVWKLDLNTNEFTKVANGALKAAAPYAIQHTLGSGNIVVKIIGKTDTVTINCHTSLAGGNYGVFGCLDTNNRQAIVYGISVFNDHPVIEVDPQNRKYRVVGFVNGNEITGISIAIVKHRFAFGGSIGAAMGMPGAIDFDETITYNGGWQPLPASEYGALMLLPLYAG